VAFTQPGTKVKVEVLRKDDGRNEWRATTVEIEIGREPGEPNVTRNDKPRLIDRLDVSLGSVTDQARRKLGLVNGQGLLVERVGSGGIGQRIGLSPGDVILEAARREVKNLEEFAQILEENLQNRISILVQRENRTLYLTLFAPELR
jgi:S1-C subfamily serine protease